MRHKYTTTGIVLSRVPIGEASAFITLLTPDLGLIRARAQSVRKPGAKLAAALQTFSESDVVVVRGKDGWRLSGAVLGHPWFTELSKSTRLRAGRITSLIMRLVHADALSVPFGTSTDMSSDSTSALFTIFSEFLTALTTLATDAEADAAECLAALRVLRITGVDAGEIPGGETGDYSQETLSPITANRSDYVVRINHGIAASGL